MGLYDLLKFSSSIINQAQNLHSNLMIENTEASLLYTLHLERGAQFYFTLCHVINCSIAVREHLLQQFVSQYFLLLMYTFEFVLMLF